MNFYREFLDEISHGAKAVLGIVVETEGSTSQVVGAKIVVRPDGTSFGTVGGGAVEAEALRVGARCLETQKAQLLSYSLASEYSPEAGPICGGRMRILLSLADNEHREPIRQAVAAIEKREKGVLIISAVEDSSLPGTFTWVPEMEIDSSPIPLKPGFVRDAIRKGKPIFSLDETGTGAYIEPILPTPRLLIVGAGHCGQALAQQGHWLGFEIWIFDDRPDLLDPTQFPAGVNMVAGDPRKELPAFLSDRNTYVVIVTRGHHLDAEALRVCVRSDAAYVGMIGSNRKVTLLREHFLQEKLATEAEWNRLFTPIGLDIGAVTVKEIATSILAQIIAVKNKQMSSKDSAGSMTL